MAVAPRAQQQPHSLLYNLGVLALAAALFGLALAYGIDALGKAAKGGGAGHDQNVTRAIGGRQLSIPATWLRGGEDSGAGFSKQVELSLTLPLGADAAPVAVGVMLVPRSQVRPSSSLLDGVYLHQFQAAQLSGPPGLIGKPLVAADGYAGETVWYDPISVSPFVAKCLAPDAGQTEGRCLRSVYLGPGIAAIYDFGTDVLAAWRQFDHDVLPRLEQIGAL
jgi:hypothetical protein